MLKPLLDNQALILGKHYSDGVEQPQELDAYLYSIPDCYRKLLTLTQCSHATETDTCA